MKQKPASKKDEDHMTLAELEAHAQEHEECTKPHYHKDENGFLVQCYHVCRKGVNGIKETLMSPAFWIATTICWPIEHVLWERVPGFSHLAHFMGLH